MATNVYPKQMSIDDWIVITQQREENPDISEKECPWFWGRLNRSVAEDILLKSNKYDGTFLVRESDALSVRNDPVYMISVLLNGEIHHVEVEKCSSGKFAIANVRNATEYKSLEKLITHYRSKRLDLDGGGQTKLKFFLENDTI